MNTTNFLAFTPFAKQIMFFCSTVLSSVSQEANEQISFKWTIPLMHFAFQSAQLDDCHSVMTVHWTPLSFICKERNSPLRLPHYSPAHTSPRCSKSNNPEVSVPSTGVSYRLIFPRWVFQPFPTLQVRILDITKFEKPLNPQHFHSHPADLITHSGWDDILRLSSDRWLFVIIIPAQHPHSPSHRAAAHNNSAHT